MTMQYRVLLAAITLLSAALLSTPALTADPEASRYYEDAFERFTAGDPNGALIQLKNSLQRDPGQLPAKILMGRIYLTLGQAQAAEEQFVEAGHLGADPLLFALPLAQARNALGKFKTNVETIRPTSMPADLASDLWVELGLARLGNGDQVGADIAFEEALQIAPGKVTALLGLVSVQLDREDYDAAEKLAAEALGTSGENAEAWFSMGVVMQKKGQLEGAEAHFSEARRLQPDHLSAALAEATLKLHRGLAAEAVPLLQKVLETRPWSLKAAYLLSQALRSSGEKEAADKALAYAAELVANVTPTDLVNRPPLMLLASLVTYDAGQYETSYEFMDTYLRQKPDDARARRLQAKLFVAMDKPLPAARVLRSLANQYPKDAQIQIMLGDVNVQLKNYLAAEEHYATALSLTTSSPELVSKLGLAQHGRGRSDLAIETVRSLVESTSGKNAGASMFLAMLYFDHGELDAAHTATEEVLRIQPDNLLAINLQAVIAVSKGKYAQGRALFKRVLEIDAGFEPARFNLIKLDIIDKRFQAAQITLDESLAANATHQLALRAYAELFLAQNQPEKAIVYLERIRAADPRAVQDILRLSRLYESTGSPDEALSTVIALDKNFVDEFTVKLRLAQLRLKRGEIDEARSILVDAAQLAGSNLSQRLLVADLQIKAGALNDVVQGMQRALAENPEAVEPRLILARVYALEDRIVEADDIVSGLLAKHPDNVEALTLLGNIRLVRGQADDAIEQYRHAKALADDANLAISLHRAMVMAGQDNQALKELAAWDRQNPENPAVMGALADHYARTGREQTAIGIYQRLIRINPGNAVVHNNLAVALMPIDTEQALRSAMRAYELAPTNAAVLDTVGWIMVQLGDLETGLARLREAVARNGRLPEIRYHLAVALEEYGNLSAARRELRQALAGNTPFPGRDEAAKRLARIERLVP